MIERWTLWWGGRSVRERWMLGFMVALIGAVILWFGILSPLWAAGDRASQSLDRAIKQRSDVTHAVARLRTASQNKAAVTPFSGSLDSAVSATAQAAGFSIASVTPQADGTVTVSVPAIKSVVLWAWVGALAQQGIVVERLSVRSSGDGSLAADISFRGQR